MTTGRRLLEVSRLATSEIMRRAARELDPIDKVLADELRLRATWIKAARHDTGVSQERRLAIAAIEDGGP